MITISTQKVKADSGFDTSYDSGGSSWDSSSSSDWDSGNYSSSGGGSFIGLIIFTVIFIIAIKSALDKSKSTNVHPSIVDSSLSDDEIRKYIPNFDRNKFITDRFNDYVQIQNAWMNFDYNTLRSKLTDELYNQYAMQLDTMKVKNEQNIMRDFNIQSMVITNIKEENGELEVTTNSVISFYDYIIQNGRVVRGNVNRRITSLYEMKFVCNKEAMSNKCPSCHAPLNNNSSQVCPYCNSVIDRIGANWILSRIDIKSSSQKENKDIESLNYIIEKDPNFSESIFISKVKNTYIMLMKSITENNIDKVKYKLSDELYNKILEEMKYYDMKALAQVYDEIKIKNAYIIDTSENNNEFKILVLLDVKYKFYTVNKKTKKPNFLSYNKKVENKYTWYFQRKLMLKKIAYHQNVKVVEQT